MEKSAPGIRILTKEIFWVAFTGFFTMIAGLAAAWSVWLTVKAGREQFESGRPYISISSPGIKEYDPGKFRIQFDYSNIGERPAKNFTIEFFLISTKYEIIPLANSISRISNDIIPKAMNFYAYSAPQITPNWDTHFEVFVFNYQDAIESKNHSNTYYFKWLKNKARPEFWDLNNASFEEGESLRQAILSHAGTL
jgi:hypothetical protein